MGRALYRKYRSKSLDEVVGQEHITKTLARALAANKLSHAYLFTGPRGVGKTSVARILAHAANGLTYEDDAAHLDIIEIDAASNRRIDEIRDLREKVRILPTTAQYKVYIVDEVHMLTKEAFNALLKTLEEPPQHVIFILATTEAYKLPETIISRTQHFTFKPVEAGLLVNHLRAIANAEKINIHDDALALIAAHSEGSVRDSISLLDQASSFGRTVAIQDIEHLLGLAPQALLEELYEALIQSRASQLVEVLKQLREQGLSAALVAKQLADRLRQALLDGTVALAPVDALALLKTLLEVPAKQEPDRWLETALLEVVLRSGNKIEPSTSQDLLPSKAEKIVTETVASKPAAVSEPVLPKEPIAGNGALWDAVVAKIKLQYNTLYGVLRMSQADIDDKKLQITLSFNFPFHKKRLDEAKNRQIMIDVIKELSGKNFSLATVLSEKKAEPPEANKTIDKSLETINDIFGGAEMLES